MERKIYASIHTHSMDLFDSHNDPDELCKRMKELGGEGLVLTQHGVLTCVEPMRAACAENGLKFVPGIEAYYRKGDEKQRKHLILIAKDETGYKAISKAATEGNDADGMAVMTDELLDKYFAGSGHGHVIATSACINGIPGMILRSNEAADLAIEKARKKQAKKGLDPEDKVYQFDLARKKELTEAIETAKKERDVLKKLSETPFKKRENSIAKMEGEEKEAALEELEKDKKISAKALEDLEGKKKEIRSLTQQLSKVNKDLKSLETMVEVFTSCEKEIKGLEASKKSEEELYTAAKDELLRLSKIFGEGNFFVEVQNHGLENEEYVYPKLARAARELHLPIVATNDVHMTVKSDDEVLRRQILHSKRWGMDFEEPREDSYEYYLKDDKELKEALIKILPEDVADEGIANIRTIFDMCDAKFTSGQHYPRFPVPDGMTTTDVFHKEIKRGIRWRFPEGFPEGYKERLDKETGIIESMGYVDYHLIVKDFLEYGRLLSCVPYDRLDEAPLTIDGLKKWTRSQGWSGGFTIGPGRGSAVGSLVCYLLGITSLDPIKYDLLFERFLNPERVSMPDIDSDIANNIRPYVIRYVQNKYGSDAVCSIITFSLEAPKGAIRSASKYYALKKYNDGKQLLSLGDMIARKIPTEPGTSFSTVLGNGKTVYESLIEEYSDNEDAVEILKWAKVIEGTLKAYGVHAAGVVISDNADIKEYLPLRWNKSKEVWTTQCEMTTVEEKGLLKMDFLGLKTLDIITDTLRLINKRTGRKIDILNDIPMEETEIYEEIFAKGNTNSVFQFESNEMKKMLKRFRPEKFEDLIILVSMFRPGPMQFIDGVIDVKNGKKPEYITPELEPILGKTYGAIVYQEQVMEIFQKLAGYTLGGADQVRRYMSKKKADKLAHERNVFIDGCKKNGIDADKANMLFDQMNEFAKYAFNKSHAAAYAANAYYTAWLKYHYPAEFITAAMNWADIKKIPGLMKEAKMFGVNVLPPDINKSEQEFSVDDAGNILFGLGSVKAVGGASDEIIREREENGIFTSFIDFFMRTNVNSGAVKALISAGALDAFCDNRRAMYEVVDTFKDLTKALKDKQSFIDDAEKLLPHLGHIRSEDSFAQVLKELHLKKTDFPKRTDKERLSLRIDNAKKRIASLKRELSEVSFPLYLKETTDDRLKGEKEFLGHTVTGHPMDNYPASKEVGATPADEVTSDTKKLQGVISGLSIKQRKSDNADMAFFDIEDATGSISASCFASAYAKHKDLIREGNVLIFEGWVSKDDSEESFVIRDVSPARKRSFRIAHFVNSYAIFHADKEDAFRKKYEDVSGSEFYLYDRSCCQFRKALYKVSEAVFKEPDTEKI